MGQCPPAEKAIIHSTSIRHLNSSAQRIKELIKIYTRHLARIDDIIWDDREDEIACHVRIGLFRQLEAFVTCFPRILCETDVEIWLADSIYFGLNVSDSLGVSSDQIPHVLNNVPPLTLAVRDV